LQAGNIIFYQTNGVFALLRQIEAKTMINQHRLVPAALSREPMPGAGDLDDPVTGELQELEDHDSKL
jgi:hypothetical protein